VHLDVVGVAVVAVLVVGEQYVCPLALQDVGEAVAASHVRPPERRGVVVVGRAHHPRIAVAQELDPVDPEAAADRMTSTCRRSTSVSPGARRPSGACPPSPRGVDDHHAVALIDRPGEAAAGGDALVVGVGVERNESGHSLVVHHVNRSPADRFA
jgi:hypothetical protein